MKDSHNETTLPDSDPPVYPFPLPETSKQTSGQGRKALRWILLALILTESAVFCFLCFFRVPRWQKDTYGPEQTAARFFTDIVNGRYEAAFEALNLPQDDFLSPDGFARYCGAWDFSHVSHFEVAVANCIARIDYQSDGGSSGVFSVPLTQSEEKKNHFFEVWQIHGAGFVRQNLQIQALRDAEVTVDGIVLTPQYITGSSDPVIDSSYSPATVTYTIPRLFAGTHVVTVSSPLHDTLYAILDTEIPAILDCTDMMLSQASMEALAKTALSNFQTVYDSAMQGKRFDILRPLFSQVPELCSAAEDAYAFLLECFSSDSSPTEITLQNLTAEVDPAGSDVTLSGTYVLEYYSQGYLETYPHKKTIQRDFQTVFRFYPENNQWLQMDLSAFPFYY